jgi:hypothetical protein
MELEIYLILKIFEKNHDSRFFDSENFQTKLEQMFSWLFWIFKSLEPKVINKIKEPHNTGSNFESQIRTRVNSPI